MKTIQKIIVVTLMSLLSFHDSLVYATEHIIAKSQKYTEFQCVRFNPSYWEPSKTYTYDEKGPMAYLRIDNGLVEIHIPAIGDLPTMDFKGPYLSLEDEKRFSIDHYLVLGGYHGPISGKPSYFGWEYSYDTSPRCVNSYEICGDGRLIYEDGEYISEYIASVTIGLGAYKDRPSLKLYKRNKGQPTNQTETTDAETDPGEDEGVGILDSIIKGITPAVIAAVLGGLAVVGIAIGAAASRRRKRKTRKQSQAQDTQNISYNMYVSKDFGDAIRRGAAPVRVYARIAKVVNETEYDWPQLTQMIQCSGEGLSVRPLGMVGNKMCAEVQAGNDNQSSQGTVKFVLSSPTGVFQRRVVFRLVDGPRIVFPGETADGKAWDLNEDNSTVVSIAGVRSFQKLRFVIVDAVSDPTEIRFSPPGDIIVRHTPDDKQRFAYYAYIENNTKPAVKEAEVFADKQEIEIPIEAYFANGDVARSYFTVELYPEGLSVLISGGPNPLRPKTPGARQVLVNGRLEVVSYATREKGELTLDPVITPTGFDLCYAYLEKGKPVVVTEPRYFELQPLKEESENTRGILEKYHYQRGWYISGFALRPSDSIPELESPYHVKMFVIATVGEMTDWMDVPIRLLGEPFSPMKAWEEEFRGLCEAVLRYYPAEVAHREIAYIRENFSDPEVWDKSKLRIIRYETIGRAQQFWLNQYGYEMQLVSYYDLTEAVFKKPTRFIGDTAFKIVARFYWGENESWITPLKDLFVDVVDEAFWNYAFTGDASVDVVEKIMDQATNTLENYISISDSSGRGLNFSLQSADTKKLASVLCLYMLADMAKNYYNMTPKDFYDCLKKTFLDVTSMSVKKIIGAGFQRGLASEPVKRLFKHKWIKAVTEYLHKNLAMESANIKGKSVDGTMGHTRVVDKTIQLENSSDLDKIGDSTGFLHIGKDLANRNSVLDTKDIDLRKDLAKRLLPAPGEKLDFQIVDLDFFETSTYMGVVKSFIEDFFGQGVAKLDENTDYDASSGEFGTIKIPIGVRRSNLSIMYIKVDGRRLFEKMASGVVFVPAFNLLYDYLFPWFTLPKSNASDDPGKETVKTIKMSEG